MAHSVAHENPQTPIERTKVHLYSRRILIYYATREKSKRFSSRVIFATNRWNFSIAYPFRRLCVSNSLDWISHSISTEVLQSQSKIEFLSTIVFTKLMLHSDRGRIRIYLIIYWDVLLINDRTQVIC